MERTGKIISCKTISLILLLGALIALPADAQRDPPKTDTARFGSPDDMSRVFRDYVYGVVKSINHDEMILDKTPFGDEQSFQLSSKTKFFRDGKPTTLDNFKPGDQVWVEMKKKKKTGERLARKVLTGLAPTKELLSAE